MILRQFRNKALQVSFGPFEACHREAIRRMGVAKSSSIYPLNEGGSIDIVSKESASDVFRLDLKSIAQGLDSLATKYPRHFADLVNENPDAITADVLLQCCLFGELIYG
jgi:hypothetical protein